MVVFGWAAGFAAVLTALGFATLLAALAAGFFAGLDTFAFGLFAFLVIVLVFLGVALGFAITAAARLLDALLATAVEAVFFVT